MLELLIGTTRSLLARSITLGLENYKNERYNTLYDAFNEAADNVVGDERFAKRVINYARYLRTKNADHISWFGGNLLGVDRIKLAPSDVERWFDEVLEVDENLLRECVHAVPSINTDWNVSSDIFNLSCIWAIHRLVTSSNQQSRLIKQAQVEVGVILQFRFYTSIWFNQFSNPVDKAAAEATYQSLSLKFRLRQLGSWGALLEHQAEALVDPKGIRARTLKTFSEDDDVIRIVTDISTRCRAVVKDMYGPLEAVRAANSRITVTGSTAISVDGDKIIKDAAVFYNTASYYLLDAASNPTNFIREDLVYLVCDIMPTVSEKALRECLTAIASAPDGRLRQSVNWMMENTLQHAFEYISSNRIRVTDAGQILTKLRAIYTAPKTTGELLPKIRTEIERFAKKNCFLRSPSALAAVRTTIMLYFVVRALAYNQYK